MPCSAAAQGSSSSCHTINQSTTQPSPIQDSKFSSPRFHPVPYPSFRVIGHTVKQHTPTLPCCHLEQSGSRDYDAFGLSTRREQSEHPSYACSHSTVHTVTTAMRQGGQGDSMHLCEGSDSPTTTMTGLVCRPTVRHIRLVEQSHRNNHGYRLHTFKTDPHIVPLDS